MIKTFIGLVYFCSLISVVQADEFNLSFSSDIINSAQPMGNELDALPLTSPENQNNAVQPLLPETKTETTEVKQTEERKKNDEPFFKARVRESRRQLAKDRATDMSSQNNAFAPIQTAPTDSFFAQYQRDVMPKMEFNSDNPAQSMPEAGVNALKQMNEGLRTLVGEELYSRMVWAYLDVKELDDWIYASIDQSGLFSQDSFLMGLNDRLFAGLATFTGQSVGGENGNSAFNDWQKEIQTQQGRDVKSVMDKEAMRANLDSQSLFFAYLKYLTLLNFIYLILTILALVYVGRFCRFMIRQQ